MQASDREALIGAATEADRRALAEDAALARAFAAAVDDLLAQAEAVPPSPGQPGWQDPNVPRRGD